MLLNKTEMKKFIQKKSIKQEDLTNGLNLKSIGNYMKHVKQQKRKFK